MSSVTTNFLKIFRHFFGDIKSAAAHKFVRGGENSDILKIIVCESIERRQLRGIN